MNALPILPPAQGFQTLPAAIHRVALEEAGSREAWHDDDDRLPPGIAYPIILLFSVSGWALIVTIGLWLYRVLG